MGDALLLATQVLENGKVPNKLVAVCEPQGGLRELKPAPFTRTVEALQAEILTNIDNRRLVTVANWRARRSRTSRR